MLLADMGAEIVRILREGESPDRDLVSNRGRHDVWLDLKSPTGLAACLDAIAAADVLIEGFRPGVMERLGLGPDEALARNPRLIYGRMTGWGQDGPLAKAAGHDINYIALTGALAAIGPQGGPSVPPLNLVGDFGGGSLYLAFGIAAALVERATSGKGQVIDAAIVDGTASLMAMFHGRPLPLVRDRSLLGGAAPYYHCYVCADGEQIAVGALEPKFYAELMARVGADAAEDRDSAKTWPGGIEALAAVFRTRTRDEWCAILEGTDACFAPVLSIAEAPCHAHMKARGVYESRDGVVHPGPAPRLSRTPGAIQDGAADGADLLAQWSTP